jgi:hypothetical protein
LKDLSKLIKNQPVGLHTEEEIDSTPSKAFESSSYCFVGRFALFSILNSFSLFPSG